MTPTSANWFENLRRSRKMKATYYQGNMKATAETGPALPPRRRLDFGDFVDKLFWFIVTGVAIYCANQMKEMGHSVEELNKNMSLIIYQMTESQDRLGKLDQRLEYLEAPERKGRRR